MWGTAGTGCLSARVVTCKLSRNSIEGKRIAEWLNLERFQLNCNMNLSFYGVQSWACASSEVLELKIAVIHTSTNQSTHTKDH